MSPHKLIDRKIVPLVFCALLFTPMFATQANATDDCNTIMTTKIDQFYQGPVYVDSYWTTASQSLNTQSSTVITEREVGPGEGKATLAIVLTNRSLKDISAITGYLTLPEGFEPAGTSIYTDSQAIKSASGNRLGFHTPAVASHNGIVTAKSSFTLYFDINITNEAKVDTIPTNLVLQYYITDQLGLCTSALITFPMVLSGKTILDITTPDSSLTPNVPNTVNINIVNKGTADATGVIAAIVGLGDSGTRSQNNADGSVVLDSSDTEIINLGDKVFSIGTIPAGTSVSVHTIIYPGKDAAGTVQNMNVQLSYSNSHGDTGDIIIGTGLIILPIPVDSSINVSYADSENSHILTAEKLEDMSFIITNNSPSMLSDVVVSLVPQSTSVTIVGDSKWTIPSLEPDESKKITIKALAAKTLIATPTTFSANLNYISDGEGKTDTQTLGAFVVGEINLELYDVTVNYVGDIPNIVGSLLNKGNTNALYTAVELVTPEGRHNKTAAPASQYVGDISADSSIPFSIPVPGLKPGQNHVEFKVKYADDLKNFHDLIFDSNIAFEQKHERPDKRQTGPDYQIIIIGVISASIVTIVVFIMKKRKKQTPGLGNFESEIDTLLDEHSNKTHEEK